MGKNPQMRADQPKELFKQPPDAEFYLYLSYYKFGRHGFVYRWSENWQEWMKSDIDKGILFLKATRLER